MSGLGTGISAFVNGFVGGRDVRNRWEDRKIDQERQKRIDQIRDNQENRAQEAHDMNLEGSGLINQARRQAIRQTDQQWGDSQSMRDALNRADAAAEGGLIRAGTSTAGTAPLGAVPQQEQARGSFNIPQWDSAVARQDTPLGLGTVATDPAPALPAQDGPPDRQPAPAMGAAPVAPVIEGDTIVPPPPPEGGYQETDNRHQWGARGAIRDDVDRAGHAVGNAVGDAISRTGESIVNAGVGSMQRLNAPFQAASEYALGRDVIGAPERVDLNKDGIRQTPTTPLMTKGWGALQASESAPTDSGPASKNPQKAAVATAAADVMNDVGNSPAMQAAAEAVPAETLGATRGTPMTAEKRDKGARTFMQSYRENGAPLVMRELMRQGRFDEAHRFDAFIRSGTAQDGMEAWGRGLFAAMQGDIDTAAENLMEAYNSAGYFDDGFEIVKGDSRLIHDDGGDVVGVRLAMRNQTTGEIVVQQDRIDNFIQRALWITSPEKAFEAAAARAQAQQEALLKDQERRQGVANDLIKGEPDRIARAAQEIYKNSIGLDGQPTMTYAEALAEAQIAFSGEQPGDFDLGDVPVARRAQ